MDRLRRWEAAGAFGERRMDLRFAAMTMHIVAALRSSKSGPVKLAEFLPPDPLEPPPPEPDIAEQVARFDRAAGLKG